MKQLTKAQHTFVEGAAAIRMSPPTPEDAAFLARQFVQATFPHADPKTDTWRRVNGRFALGIRAGYNVKTGESYGLPYGIIPRLLLFWITTEAVKTQSPRLHLGASLADFMREVGLDPSHGGVRGDAKRLHQQMQRLLSAEITFQQDLSGVGGYGEEVQDMRISDHRVLWWTPKIPGQRSLWQSYADLSPKFYDAVTAAPVPVDTRALRILKRSPLALDLYALSCYEAHRVQKTGRARVIPWRALMMQLGADYARADKDDAVWDFARNCRKTLRKICAVMPSLKINQATKGGLMILPDSLPAIPHKSIS